MKVRFNVKRPDKTRRSFSVVKDSLDTSGRTYETLENEELDSINKNLTKGLIDETQAYHLIKTQLIPKLKKEIGVKERIVGEAQIGEQNLKLFREFWKEEYELRKLRRPEGARNDFLTALRYTEPLSLVVASRQDLQKHLDKKLIGRAHKRYVGKINQMLRFAGREFRLFTKKAPLPLVRYVTWEELPQVLAHINDPVIRDLAIVLFCTGVRLGEAFVLGARDLKSDQSIFISKQLTDKLEITEIKNSKPHKTILLKEGVEAYKRWCAVPDRQSYRKKCQHPIINAARKTFPDEERQISPHDLRHSYAIHVLAKGASLDDLTFLLGDTISTVQMYYAGFVMSDKSVDRVSALINK